MPTPSKLLSLALLSLSLTGCATSGLVVRREPELRDATAALITHPEFERAAKAAPGWVNKALATITQYEAELARK